MPLPKHPWRVSGELPETIHDADGFLIADVFVDDDGNTARLIAALPSMRDALDDAEKHFDEIARKAAHWASVFANNEAGEARWCAIRNHARYRATVIRAVVAALDDADHSTTL